MPMRRTSVFLDEQTLLRLQKVAERTGVSSASLIREAISAYLAAPRAPAGIPSIAGQFESDDSDTSERVDELLWRDPHR